MRCLERLGEGRTDPFDSFWIFIRVTVNACRNCFDYILWFISRIYHDPSDRYVFNIYMTMHGDILWETKHLGNAELLSFFQVASEESQSHWQQMLDMFKLQQLTRFSSEDLKGYLFAGNTLNILEADNHLHSIYIHYAESDVPIERRGTGRWTDLLDVEGQDLRLTSD